MPQEYYTKEQNADFYQKLRTKIHKWADSKEGRKSKWIEYLLLAPDLFHLLTKLVIDKSVSIETKSKIAAVIVYFISPIDLIPEALIGPGGYIDDIVLAAYIINIAINQTSAEIVNKHWAGEGNILSVIQNITKDASNMIGKGILSKLKKKL